MDDAIRGHEHLVREQAIRLSSPRNSDWDDLISDGTLALWQALSGFDPARRDLLGYLRLRIRHRQIDGMRSRSGSRRCGQQPAVVDLADHLDAVPADAPDLGAVVDLSDTVQDLGRLDPRLPGIAALVASGYTAAEIGAMTGVSRQWVSHLLSLAQRPRATGRTPMRIGLARNSIPTTTALGIQKTLEPYCA
ncbi:hypothetical protein GT755_12425 [Herbidospora sp. NEAU-GS84]|uniref:RNA polymerase sigma-70 region 2 domain-containing protein n=1 Tax=Herbidospora solisilvae TaxID=2696284 RepID=A0A7C9J8G2_9ACTN|nr:sigma-70 family RNA polymerase sigma factor [Herbidospora solisilvae]NAS22488.1 hypothetical protein [Herbidospora solisilvae]